MHNICIQCVEINLQGKGTTAQEFLARPRATRAQPRSFILLYANCDLIRMLLIFHLKEYVCSLPSQMN